MLFCVELLGVALSGRPIVLGGEKDQSSSFLFCRRWIEQSFCFCVKTESMYCSNPIWILLEIPLSLLALALVCQSPYNLELGVLFVNRFHIALILSLLCVYSSSQYLEDLISKHKDVANVVDRRLFDQVRFRHLLFTFPFL